MLDYSDVRRETIRICSGLETEDFVVQTHDFVSPPKWHLGHTTWLFETMCLQPFFAIDPVNPEYAFLFNSYYEALGAHEEQARRGVRSRPTVLDILRYRSAVDARMQEAEAMSAKLSEEERRRWRQTVTIGLHHEQQHQELLFMDIKNILSHQPGLPELKFAPLDGEVIEESRDWWTIPEGVYEIGFAGESFAYDNEGPRHKVYLREFRLRKALVTNLEYLEFIADGGYARPELWLSDGWAWAKSNGIRAPLYWRGKGMLFTLQGEKKIEPNAPVAHVSFFEADAFARWKKSRLPTEAEWEVACACEPRAPLWQWTASAYLPYPGFKPFTGVLQEYNGKFMSGQMVLRGGCLATPKGHYRSTYRNFFYPQMRWMFSGIRLCE